MTLAIIPCRAGSKGLPHKNIRPLQGMPLVHWSIRAALESRCFDSVIVTTDSEEYAEIARRSGAEVPWLREGRLATDISRSSEVILDALDRCEKAGDRHDRFMLLQPTSPLRTAVHVREAFARMDALGARAIVSVCESEHSPAWMNTLPQTLSLDGFIRREDSGVPRQAHAKHFRVNGALYLAEVPWYREHEDFFSEGAYAMVMDARSSIDIDTEFDFEVADFLLGRGDGKGG